MKNNKIQSLKSNLQIKELFKTGKSLKTNDFLLKYRKNTTGNLQFAISVNKKIFRTAVIRNKIKRQIRQIVRSLKQIKSIDMLVIVASNYLNNKYETNKKNIIWNTAINHFTDGVNFGEVISLPLRKSESFVK